MIALILVVILFIWLIALQGTVSQLQQDVRHLSKLLSVKPTPIKPAAPVTEQTQSTTAPTTQPAVSQPAPSAPPSAPSPVLKTPPAAVAARIQKPATAQPKPQPAKPPVEITTAKLFSWIGGFMLFLGVIFGIKYSIENNLLSPTLRIILSILTGTALTTAGYLINNPKYRITAHTLLGSGLAIVYAAIFCAHTFYQFIDITPAFILMAATSFIALGAALKKDAKYVGYLGAIIAFLTPILLNNGTDAWVAFFLYVFCINAAAAYAAVRKEWSGLLICTLSFTWLSQAAWLFPFASYKLLGVVTFFSLYAIASAWLASRCKAPSLISYALGGFLCLGLTLMFPVAAELHVFFTETSRVLSTSFMLLGYILLVNGLVLVLAGKQYIDSRFGQIVKVLSFLLLGLWMLPQAALLPQWLTLGACVLFTALNSGAELLICRGTRKPDLLSTCYPVATMAGLLILSVSLGQTSALNFVSMFGILGLLLVAALILAVFAGIVWVSFAAVVLIFLFLLATLLMGEVVGISVPCILISGFIPLFLCAGAFFFIQKMNLLPSNSSNQAKGVGAVTALAPFVLIWMSMVQSGANVSLNGTLGATLIACALTALAAWLYRNTFTLPAAAAGAGIVQLTLWSQLVAQEVMIPLDIFTGWVAASLALFMLLPFLSKERFWDQTGTWIACAIAGLSSCGVELSLISHANPDFTLAIIPMVLLVIYAGLLSKLWGTSRTPQASPVAIGFMSGATLVFLTIIFPLQIHNHWLAVAWAGEAVFLAWLHKQLPYRGWQITSAGLLCVISIWLLLCGDSSSSLPQTRIWNWYLGVYGACAAALFTVATWWDGKKQWQNAFYVLGGCMLFWLLNIEIAHWFSLNEEVLSFEFTGQLAQAIAYTLGWAIFAFCLIGWGLFIQKSTVSKVGVGVMVMALGKFFFYDIWQLEAIYRILGSFVLAILLIAASFWYQTKRKM